MPTAELVRGDKGGPSFRRDLLFANLLRLFVFACPAFVFFMALEKGAVPPSFLHFLNCVCKAQEIHFPGYVFRGKRMQRVAKKFNRFYRCWLR